MKRCKFGFYRRALVLRCYKCAAVEASSAAPFLPANSFRLEFEPSGARVFSLSTYAPHPSQAHARASALADLCSTSLAAGGRQQIEAVLGSHVPRNARSRSSNLSARAGAIVATARGHRRAHCATGQIKKVVLFHGHSPFHYHGHHPHGHHPLSPTLPARP